MAGIEEITLQRSRDCFFYLTELMFHYTLDVLVGRIIGRMQSTK